MTFSVLDETIESVSVLNTISVDVKKAVVAYQVEYNSNTYNIDMEVIFVEVGSSTNRFVKKIKIEDVEIDFNISKDRFKEDNVYDVIRDGICNKFPSLPLAEVHSIVVTMMEKIINRLNVFYISIEDIEI